MTEKLILASGSPRRRELLSMLGLSYEVVTSDVEEAADPDLAPSLMVEKLSLLKAADVAARMGPDALVIGADTMVFLDGNPFGKPKDQADAKAMLTALAGRAHDVLTGVSVVRTADAASVSVYEETRVHMKALTEEEMDRYIASGEPMDKAGAYGIQGLGSLLIERIEGDYFNVVGLPLCRLARLLAEEFDFPLL